MALQYGLNFPASNIKRILEQNDKTQSGVRSWRQLFGGASLGFGAQSDALTTDYSSAMAQAYRANFEKSASIMGGGLSAGSTKQLLSMSRQELSDTYNTYLRNYASDLSKAMESYGSEVNMIDTALTERATNMSKILNYAKKYYEEELFGSTRTPEGETEAIDYFADKGLDWLSDKSKLDQIIVNPDGSLTQEGIKFFDAIFNATPQGFITEKGEATRGFDKWLSDTDPELREWWLSQDEFNYNFAGSNKGTLNILTGRESTDNTFDNRFENALNSINSKVQDSIGIGSLSDIGSSKLANKTYDEWRARYDKRKAWYDKQTPDMKSHEDFYWWHNVNKSYISDYTKFAKIEYDTARAEMKKALGDDFDEFWAKYGAEVDRLYNKIKDIRYDDSKERYIDFYNKRFDWKASMAMADKLRNSGLDLAFKRLYEAFKSIGSKKSAAKPSGF